MTHLEGDLLDHIVTGRDTHSDGSKIVWGAWMTACLEGLRGLGYVELTGSRYVATPEGVAAHARRAALKGGE